MNKLLISFLFSIPLLLTSARASDPFKNTTLHTLDNGLKIILAPDTKSEFIQLRVNVGVGFVHEKDSNYGVSHLLEHVLFRDTKLKDDMSYLQLFKEKEGSANGVTSWDRTTYYVTLKKGHLDWLLKTVHHMIMSPALAAKHVETEKKTVLLEIGEPNPIEKALGFDFLKFLSPKYLKQESFTEEYFKVKRESGYTSTEEQLSTLRLTHKQVVDHYKKFYDPSNMQIILSGNFQPEKALKDLKRLWGKHKSSGIGDQRPKYKAQDPEKSFSSHNVSSSTSRFSLGYLVNNASIQEREILDSYTEYLSHRLMKILRNKDGETYTAYGRSSFSQGFGHFTVSLQTSKEKFYKNKELVEKMMQEELLKGQLKDEEVEEAKKLFLNKYSLWSRGASGSERMAEKMLHMYEQEGTWKTPFDVLNSVSPEEYRKTLKKFSNPKLKYESILHPELFFYEDELVFTGIFAIFFFFFFRRVIQKKFENNKVKWVRKVAFPPLKSLELFMGFLISFGLLHTIWIMEKLTQSTINKLGIYGFYLAIPLLTFTVIGTAQAIICYFPRKLYFMNDVLVIKSVSYYSKHIKKEDIKQASAQSLFEVLTSPRKLIRLWNSWHYYNPLVWQKGLLIELKSGKLYFFSMKNAKKAEEELAEILGRKEVVEEILKTAA